MKALVLILVVVAMLAAAFTSKAEAATSYSCTFTDPVVNVGSRIVFVYTFKDQSARDMFCNEERAKAPKWGFAFRYALGVHVPSGSFAECKFTADPGWTVATATMFNTRGHVLANPPNADALCSGPMFGLARPIPQTSKFTPYGSWWPVRGFDGGRQGS